MLKTILAAISFIITSTLMSTSSMLTSSTLIQDMPSMNEQSTLIETNFTNTPVVFIRTQYADRGAYGSGVYIAPNKILTAAHVLTDGETKYVNINDSFDVPKENIELYKADYTGGESDDLAIITVPNKNHKYYNAVQDEAAKNIRILGYPSVSKYLVGYTAEGEVVNISNGLYRSTAFTTKGSSGGPVMNEKNEVIGLHVSTITAKSKDMEKKFACSIKFTPKQMKWIEDNLKK